MNKIKSKDGTMIAYQRSGQGSPLILVHGTTADHTRWVPILTTHLRKLVLYEPPIPTDIEIYPREVVSRIQALLAGGDREGAVTTFMQDIAHVPPHEMEILRSVSNWPARIAAAHTILRELRGSNEYVFEPGRFSGLTTPTLLLLGGDSPAFFKAAIEAVHAALPGSREVVMPGQQHTAMNTAPELFTREVLQFFVQESQIARL